MTVCYWVNGGAFALHVRPWLSGVHNHFMDAGVHGWVHKCASSLVHDRTSFLRSYFVFKVKWVILVYVDAQVYAVS